MSREDYLMVVEDYPDCVYCGEKTSEVGLDKGQNSVIYYCSCGEFTLVKIEDTGV